MEFFAAIGAILAFLGGLPDIIATIKGWIDFIGAWIRKSQLEKTSKELGEALSKATGPNKDTRDLEKIFNPDRTYPTKPPSDGK